MAAACGLGCWSRWERVEGLLRSRRCPAVLRATYACIENGCMMLMNPTPARAGRGREEENVPLLICQARPEGRVPGQFREKKGEAVARRPMLSLSSLSPLCPDAHSPPISSPAMRDGGGAVCWRDGADIVTSPIPNLCDLSHVHGKLGTGAVTSLRIWKA